MPFATATVIAAAGLAAGAAGAGTQFVAGRKSAKQQKRIRQAEERKSEATRRRSVRSAIREQQIKRASIVNFAGVQGIQESSAVSGATGSLSSQLGDTFGTASVLGANERAIGSASQGIANAQSLGSFGSLTSSFGNFLFQNSGTIGNAINSTFPSSPSYPNYGPPGTT